VIAGRRVLIVRNAETAPEGAFGAWLAAQGAALTVLPGEALPAEEPLARAADLVVLLGSPHGVHETHIPWIAAQREIVGRLAAAGRPILGICFGAQMLAAATGGDAAPVWRGPFIRWHGDHITPPPGAEVLARDGGTVQVFRQANRLGVQFHPEATPEILAGWVARDAARVDGPAVLAAARRLPRPEAVYAEMLRSVMAGG
jgi:GMP synthase (glutamine-hydrolysing)